MPGNGHTTGVSVFGSDEANAGRRERGRRMHTRWRACAKNWPDREGLNVPGDRGDWGKLQHLLLGGTVLRKRWRGGAGVFSGDRAAGHVCATSAFASLVARRVRENA